MKKTLLFLLCLPMTGYGQADSVQSGSPLKRHSDLVRFVDAFAYTATAPTRWDKKDLLTFGGVLVGTAVIGLLDEPVRDFWLKQDNRFLDGVERVGFHYGKPYSANLFAGGFYLVGLIIKDERTRDTGLILASTLLYCGVVQTVTKAAIGRARPATNEGFLSFHPFNSAAAYHSSPSGHMAVAVAISRIIATRVESRFVKVLCYAVAASTGISRMYMDQHWLSDIVLGGALGWFSADITNKRINSNRYGRLRDGYRISWQLSPQPGGFSLVAKL